MRVRRSTVGLLPLLAAVLLALVAIYLALQQENQLAAGPVFSERGTADISDHGTEASTEANIVRGARNVIHNLTAVVINGEGCYNITVEMTGLGGSLPLSHVRDLEIAIENESAGGILPWTPIHDGAGEGVDEPYRGLLCAGDQILLHVAVQVDGESPIGSTLEFEVTVFGEQ